DTESGDGDGDGQLEVVAGGGAGEGGGPVVGGADRLAQQAGDEEHDREVHQQRQRDADHVQRLRGDGPALQGEQDDDREQQAVERPRTDPRQEAGLVLLAAEPLLADAAGEEAREQWNTEEDDDVQGDLPHGDVQAFAVAQTQPAGQQVEVEPAEQTERQDLENGVEGDEYGGGLAVAAGEVVPDDDH